MLQHPYTSSKASVYANSSVYMDFLAIFAGLMNSLQLKCSIWTVPNRLLRNIYLVSSLPRLWLIGISKLKETGQGYKNEFGKHGLPEDRHQPSPFFIGKKKNINIW